MHNCTTIIGVIDMRQRGISFDDCRNRFGIGNSTITLIMKRFKESGNSLDTLCKIRINGTPAPHERCGSIVYPNFAIYFPERKKYTTHE